MQDRLGVLADSVRVAPEDPRQTKWDAIGNLTPLSRAKTEVHALWFADVLRGGSFFAKFQPIADLATGRTIGYEGLLRGRTAAASRPSSEMFPAARALRVERPFEKLSWMCVLEAAKGLPRESRLFLNVNPQLLAADPDDLEPLWLALEDSGVSAGQIVLDLVEAESVQPLDALAAAIARAREHGVAVALDDVTSPYRAIQCCEAFQPEWVKVDCAITRGVSRDPRRRSILKFFGRFARHFSFGLIAEGVEDAADLDVCAASGVVAAQGYFIGRPAPELPPTDAAFLRWVAARDAAARRSEPEENGNGAETEERAS